jgi:hypothetical protein
MNVHYADNKVLLKKQGTKVVSVMSALSIFSPKVVKQTKKDVFKNERSLE